MSIKLINDIAKKELKSLTQKAVLTQMARRMNDDGTEFWASMQTLSEDAGCKRRACINAVSELKKQQVIKKTGRKKSGKTFTNVYAINLAILKTLPLAKKPDDDKETELDYEDVDIIEDERSALNDINEVHLIPSRGAFKTYKPSYKPSIESSYPEKIKKAEAFLLQNNLKEVFLEEFERVWNEVVPLTTFNSDKNKFRARSVFLGICWGWKRGVFSFLRPNVHLPDLLIQYFQERASRSVKFEVGAFARFICNLDWYNHYVEANCVGVSIDFDALDFALRKQFEVNEPEVINFPDRLGAVS